MAVQGAPLSGRIALVTGGSRGIGRGIAKCLAEAGADVAVNYNARADAANEVVAAIEASGRRAVAIGADVSDRAAVERLYDQAEAALGPVDLIVANAIYSVREPFLQTKWEDFKRTQEISLFGVFHTCQIGAQRLVERKAQGNIVVIGSPHAHHPVKNAIDYNVAKAGTHQLARTMAAELGYVGIRVNIVEPGWTDTPGERKWYSDEQMYSAGARMPLGRIGQPEDIGKAVVFLCSEEASYIANAVLRVDGGSGH